MSLIQKGTVQEIIHIFSLSVHSFLLHFSCSFSLDGFMRQEKERIGMGAGRRESAYNFAEFYLFAFGCFVGLFALVAEIDLYKQLMRCICALFNNVSCIRFYCTVIVALSIQFPHRPEKRSSVLTRSITHTPINTNVQIHKH